MPEIGLDLDNTLIDYSKSCIEFSKRNLDVQINNMRELKNTLEDNNKWTAAQSWIYSSGLNFARVEEETLQFLEKLNRLNWGISIHSHKTKFGPEEFGKVPLRELMNEWIIKSKLNKYIDLQNNLKFYDSIDDKVKGIKYANPTVFVDDLYKVFKISDFPKTVKGYLFKDPTRKIENVTNISSFMEIKID